MKNDFDDFRFSVLQEIDYTDITFQLSLGDKEFVSHITEWSNNFETICQSVERLVIAGGSRIELDYDTEPTELILQDTSNGLSVLVEPSHFHKLEEISGLCDKRDFVRELYDGLLFATTFIYDDIGCGWNWRSCKMVCYNMMKSRTIEEYLRSSSVKHVGDFVAKHILVYDGREVLHICDETVGYHIPVSDSMIVKDKTGASVAEIDVGLLKAGSYEVVAKELPEDCDFWVISKDKEGFVHPRLIEREIIGEGQLFIKESRKMKELGDDPYGFTSKTLWHACDELDFPKIKHFLSIGADMTFFFRWLISSNVDGTEDEVGNPTFEETEQSLRSRDDSKAKILEYVIDHYPDEPLTEDMLKECLWHYSPNCMKVFLEHGANPTEKKEISDCPSVKVKYRSVMNLLTHYIEEGKDKYGIYLEMKDMLESAGAEDIVILNDDCKVRW